VVNFPQNPKIKPKTLESSSGKSRSFWCKFTKKKRKKKISKLLTPQNWGEKKKKKKNHFGGEPSLGVVVVASAQA
jgi:hypothetical protein